jgi:mannose-1-phosphate guanylyltransferase/mannose-6-phosphate isomerase
MSIDVQPVVMAGGSGTRLWPLSRAGYPKQFLELGDDGTLLQEAVRRMGKVAEPGLEVQPPLVVANEEHRFLVLDQLQSVGAAPASIWLEPAPRNTAPALTLAALHCTANGLDPVMIVTPSDQTVTDVPAFAATIRAAARIAAQGAIVVLGIVPDRPETGFGYIETVSASEDGSAPVARFVEKPGIEQARQYVASGRYFWNSGLFVLRASVWLAALRAMRADIADATEAAFVKSQRDGLFLRPGRDEFAAIPSESIDYAVMEKCPGSGFPLRMLPLAAGWNDLGAWNAVWQVAPKDADGNVAHGDVILTSTKGTLVHATSRLVSVVGVDDLVVVETPDAILVAHKSNSQEVKQVVSHLDRADRAEHSLHRKVHRPWGWYDSIDSGPRFQVKRILVKPGASLSLQKHHHRAEHWVVVSGTAEVTCGDRKILLTENQSTYIPLGEMHRLVNPGKVPLEIIEVQSGPYLGEDDIVRFEDNYGRR